MTSEPAVQLSACIVAAALFFTSPAIAATISAQEAGRHIGETVTVEGVAHVHAASSASFLDIGGEYPNEPFQAVIFPNRVPAFGDFNRYDGRTVNVTGQIRDYKGKPEVILSDPGQLHMK